MSKGFVLELKGISKIYNESSSDKLVIFKNINLNIKKSELIGIIAPSGTGKTSLLNICGLLDLPSCGEVIILNKNTKSLTQKTTVYHTTDHDGTASASTSQHNLQLHHAGGASRRRPRGPVRRGRLLSRRRDTRPGHAIPQGVDLCKLRACPLAGHARPAPR